MNSISVLICDDKQRGIIPHTPFNNEYMQKEFIIYYASNGQEALRLLTTTKISVILSTFDMSEYPQQFSELLELPRYFRKRWVNTDDITNLESIGFLILNCYISYIKEQYDDFFSVITPLYHTPRNLFERAYESLKSQTEKEWEWILIDDSQDLSKTFYVKSFAEKDPRIKYYSLGHSGSIGEVKYNGFSLARGRYLAELDHDDELFPQCLSKVRNVFETDESIGFVYTDCIEPIQNEYNEIVGSRSYGDDWGFGYGKHSKMVYKGQEVSTIISPPQNSKTVRHITSSPNHIRVWRKSVYEKAGRHNPEVFVCDDYELLIRTFLVTKFGHINSVEYCQYYNNNGGNNTQYERNKEIQRLTHFFSRAYDKDIHNRFIELGVPDFSWDEEKQESDFYGSDYPYNLRNDKTNLEFYNV